MLFIPYLIVTWLRFTKLYGVQETCSLSRIKKDRLQLIIVPSYHYLIINLISNNS